MLPAQHYLDGHQLVAPSPFPLLPPSASSAKHARGKPPCAPKRGRAFSPPPPPPPSAMASAATWALASPSAVVENWAASARQPPATPHCLGLPPRSRLLRASSSCQRTGRRVILMSSGITTRSATGETVATASSGEEQGSTELPEIVQTVQKAWDKVDDKYAVATIGVAAIIALWASTGVISAIDRLPLIPGVLELVGIGYTGWFVYRNLVFKPDREALLEKIKNTYSDVTGSS